jgi:hypothetical protein
MGIMTESTVESATLAWLSELGWQVKHGSEIAPDGLFAERQDYSQLVLNQRLRDALARLNPHLPPEARESTGSNPGAAQPCASPDARGRRDGRVPARRWLHRQGAGPRP